MSGAPLLSIEGLRTFFHARSRRAFVRAVDGVDLQVERGETLGIVGESGSGKTVTALSVMGLVEGVPGVIGGRIGLRTNGTRENLLRGLDGFVALVEEGGRLREVRKRVRGWHRHVDRLMAGVRGKEISMIFQNPKASLNPFMTVGEQIAEAVRLHTPLKGRGEARERALDWLERVRMDSPRMRYENYPRGLSGGMVQRAAIAMALAPEPALLIADEPTTGLDATIQATIADLFDELRSGLSLTTLVISHDIGLVRRLSDRVAVMYAGIVAETGPAADVLPRGEADGHPYAAALLASLPTARSIRERGPLAAIPGDVPDPARPPGGCPFRDRCGRITEAVRARCEAVFPPLFPAAPGRGIRCWLFEGAGA